MPQSINEIIERSNNLLKKYNISNEESLYLEERMAFIKKIIEPMDFILLANSREEIYQKIKQCWTIQYTRVSKANYKNIVDTALLCHLSKIEPNDNIMRAIEHGIQRGEDVIYGFFIKEHTVHSTFPPGSLGDKKLQIEEGWEHLKEKMQINT